MMTHMKERLAGKIGNANNNAFMLRKLFKMYDTAGSGYVSPHPGALSTCMLSMILLSAHALAWQGNCWHWQWLCVAFALVVSLLTCC